MSPDDTVLLFHHPSRKVRRTELRHFLKELTERVGGGRSVTCVITTDRELRALNKKFRGQDYATDVLSFPTQVSNGMLGEIAISFDRAAAQAGEFGHKVEEELRILMLHGVLHLAGMDHETDSGAMARAEIRWRRRLGLPPGLIERTVERVRA
jgi:probable rRNA maturation factor